MAAMFLRRNRRTVNGECYESWTLVKTVRTAKGPRQEIVATLGKEPGLESRTRHGWEQVGDLLEGRTPAPVQGELGQKLPAALQPHWAQVDLSGVRVERVRDFGQGYLGLSLWRRLGLHTVLREIIEPGQEEVPWNLTAGLGRSSAAEFPACGGLQGVQFRFELVFILLGHPVNE